MTNIKEGSMNNKEVLIIGGTGSLGQTIYMYLISHYKCKGIRIFSRDEYKQWKMQNEMNAVSTPTAYLIGDVRDKDRVYRATKNVDVIFNCAAMKQVPACENNPEEPVKTNISGAQNIINAAIDNHVNTVMHVSTDKAVYPINIYGATKTVAEKLFLHANIYSAGETKFSVCRYGNVLGSRGSIIPLFKEQAKTGTITITDRRMTRFWITLNQVAKFIVKNAMIAQGGEIFIPKMRAMQIIELANIIAPSSKVETIGIRKGEKLHECLITEEEMPFVTETEDMFIIKPLEDEVDTHNRVSYTSENCAHLSIKELKKLLKNM